MAMLAPSLLSADFANLKEEIKKNRRWWCPLSSLRCYGWGCMFQIFPLVLQ